MSETPFQRYLDAKAERFSKGEESKRVRRQVQGAMYEALWEHATGKRSLPEEMAAELAFSMKDVTKGFDNSLFRPIRRRGSQGTQPTEKICIEAAVRYLRAVDAKIIDDKHRIKTVHEAFGGSDIYGGGGLSKRTIQNWKNDERFAYVKPEGYEPELIKALLRFSGSFYSRHFSKTARAARSESK